MPSIVWPKRRNPNPGALARFGRLVHWIATCVAMLSAIGGLALIGGADDDMRPFAAVVAGLWVVSTYALGRGIRYVLSAE
ncbi:hypothetical protein [Marinivivus vitaminiproducens]|uniref:hypothetical protein n=1 Tax=Marinivivus vitaminiproducens TaxID=3035935 RepID=UPI0027A86C84|nr:hypothetical protein P4R82_22845 [Geminicoccaceae bacterium SCSIO 64248]